VATIGVASRRVSRLRCGLVVWPGSCHWRATTSTTSAECARPTRPQSSMPSGINISSRASAAGRFFFHVMASLAQMERELLVERTRAGLVAAKKLGRVGGRKRRMTESKIRSGKTLLISGVSPKRMFEKSQTDARRLRIRRVAAISMSVSEVCTLYS